MNNRLISGMDKFLPRTSSNKKGFTLVELLVVVSIIAILSVIGVATFTSVQRNARDARRKADMDAIASAFEASFSAGVYATNLTGTSFSSGNLPADPLNNSASGFTYYSNAGVPLAENATTIPSNTVDTQKSFTVCAKLEDSAKGNFTTAAATTASATGGFYCRANQQ